VAEIADILQADKPEGSSQTLLFIPSRDRGDQAGLRVQNRKLCHSGFRGSPSSRLGQKPAWNLPPGFCDLYTYAALQDNCLRFTS
jgi:hypothetical protein